MTAIKTSTAGAWLGAMLAQEGECSPAFLFRFGAELGLSEEAIRRGFAEIGANAIPTGYGGATSWTLPRVTRQAFLNWATVVGMPSSRTEADRPAFIAFWKARITAAPAAPPPQENRVPAKTAFELHEERQAAMWAEHYARQDAAAERARAEARGRNEAAAEAQRQAAKPTLDSREIYARRRREMGRGS